MTNTTLALTTLILTNTLAYSALNASDSFNDELGILDIKIGEDHLYVSKPSQAKNLASMTYLIDYANVNNDLLDIFKSFADGIGSNHGATYLTSDSNKLRSISEQGNLRHITEFTSKSSCNFFKLGDQAYVVFEILKNGECFYFPVKKPSQIIQALNAVQDGIRVYSSLSKDEQIAAIHSDIDNTALTDKTILDEMKKFASFLVEKLRA